MVRGPNLGDGTRSHVYYLNSTALAVPLASDAEQREGSAGR